MQKFKFLFWTIVLLFFGCGIPSLHPIYTKNDRITNDQILGIWNSTLSSNIKIKYDINISGDSDDEQKMKEALENISDSGEGSELWVFERAINATGVINEKDGLKVDFSLGVTSDSNLHPNAKITSRKELPFYLLTYQVSPSDKNTKNILIVNLTTINGEIYMDFFPYSLKEKDEKNRFATNFIYGHTFAKAKISDKKISLFFFDAEYISELIKEKRVRIKHEAISEDKIIFTASTKELRAFIEQFGDDEKLFADPETLLPSIR